MLLPALPEAPLSDIPLPALAAEPLPPPEEVPATEPPVPPTVVLPAVPGPGESSELQAASTPMQPLSATSEAE
jgi:hypothetical protein